MEIRIRPPLVFGRPSKKSHFFLRLKAPWNVVFHHIAGIICKAQDQYACIVLVLFCCQKLFEKVFEVGYQIPPSLASVSAERGKSLFALATSDRKEVRL